MVHVTPQTMSWKVIIAGLLIIAWGDLVLRAFVLGGSAFFQSPALQKTYPVWLLLKRKATSLITFVCLYVRPFVCFPYNSLVTCIKDNLIQTKGN